MWAVWPRARSCVPAAVLVTAAVVDLLTPPGVSSAPLLAVAPVTAVPLLRTRGIVTVGVCAMALHAVLAYADGTFGWQRGAANQFTLAAVTALAIGLNRALRTEHATASRARYAAEIAQRAVLPTPPASLGDLRVAARYVAAEDMALIGGDLYVVQDTPFGVRAMVGDVRGKGLSAVNAVSVDIGAFRFAADHAADLPSLVRSLEEALSREGRRQGALDVVEGFTTALILQFGPGLEEIAMVNHGHPGPLLLHPDGRVSVLEPAEEAPPLGITSLGPWPAPLTTFAFPPGATLLCFTDGVTEARDHTGAFYEPADRVPRMLRAALRRTGRLPDPADLLDFLVRDVSRHSGGAPQDDQALLALHRPARGPRSRRPRHDTDD